MIGTQCIFDIQTLKWYQFPILALQSWTKNYKKLMISQRQSIDLIYNFQVERTISIACDKVVPALHIFSQTVQSHVVAQQRQGTQGSPIPAHPMFLQVPEQSVIPRLRSHFRVPQHQLARSQYSPSSLQLGCRSFSFLLAYCHQVLQLYLKPRTLPLQEQLYITRAHQVLQ